MAEEKTNVLDPEKLKRQINLTEDQNAAIAAEALKEIEAEEAKEKKKTPEARPEKKEEKQETPRAKTDEALLAAKDEELNEEEKTKKQELVKAQQEAEDKRILESKDEDLKEEEKTRKLELIKAQEDEKTKVFEREVETYAKESSISLEEAREDLKSRDAIREKYKDDPKQLAKANLHMQRLYTRTQEELKAFKEAKPAQAEITIEGVTKAIEEGKFTIQGKPATKDMVISAYREKNPDITETIDDEAVLKIAAKEIRQAILDNQKEEQGKLAIAAKEKKDKVLTSLSEADKQFLPDIKPVIDNLTDAQIMNEKFDISAYLFWAKGKKTDQLIKEAEERGYKRGKEEAKIIAQKVPVGAGNTPKGPAKVALTEKQKNRALDMYDGLQATEEEKFDWYREYLKDNPEEK